MTVKEAAEETPLVASLKELDDQFLARRKAFEEETFALQTKYEKEFKEFWNKRRDALLEGGAQANVGTPACPGFWYRALKNVPELEDEIEEWDEEVLNALQDITYEWLDPKGQDGFKLVFHFAENEFFHNRTLEKVYHTKELSPYTDTLDVVKVEATPIEWRDGMDVTVEVKKKKKSGGGKKKKEKTTAEPRASFFRGFFRNLGPDEEVPADVIEQMGGESDDDDSDMDVMEMLIQDDHEKAVTIRDTVIGHAVRWYTGEAVPSEAGGDSDDDDEDEDDSESEEDSDEDDSDEDAGPRQGKKGTKGTKGKKGGDKECKQQ